MIETVLKNWKTDDGHNLTREDLKEGHIYLCSLRNGHEILINRCTFTVIKGKLHISKEANWQDLHFLGGQLNKRNYMTSSIPCGTNIPCFKLVGKLEENGGFMSNSKRTKNLIIKKISGREFSVVNKKTREKWYVDKEGGGSTPEKYWDTPLERELLKAIGVLV